MNQQAAVKHLLRAAFCVLFLSQAMRAQVEVRVTGIVQDAATARPIFGATVTLRAASLDRATRTDQSGVFAFSRVPTGTYTLVIRQLGFAVHTETIVVVDEKRILVALDRIATLDTLRVKSSQQAIYGVVAATTELRPLSNSTVEIFGTSAGSTTTDSAGRFFYPVQSTGTYLVRAKAAGFLTQTASVTVERSHGAELVLLLDENSGPANHAIEAAFSDFRQRLLRRGYGSALVPRSELVPQQEAGMVSALLASPFFSGKGLRFTTTACVLIDGTPRPGLSLNSVNIDDVEAVEVYSLSSEKSGTLQDRWPKQSPCGDTGMPRAGAMSSGRGGASRIPSTVADIVRWVVIWSRR